MINNRKHSTAIIVGAGPVGLTLALLLKDLFQKIIVLEQVSKAKWLDSNGQVFVMVFSLSAKKIVQKTGAWDMLYQTRSDYSMTKLIKRTFGQQFSIPIPNEANLCGHYRFQIIHALYQRVEEVDNIEIRFEASLEAIDFENNTCKESTHYGQIEYDLLVGADGSNSSVRDMMSMNHPLVSKEEFRQEKLFNWAAYNMPMTEELKRAFGDQLTIDLDFVGDLPMSAITHMVSPTPTSSKEGVLNSVLFYDDSMSIRKGNQLRYQNMGLTNDELDRRLDEGGSSGQVKHVHAPTFLRGSAILVGDAAHGIFSCGDAVSLGLVSCGELFEALSKDEGDPSASSIRSKLQSYESATGVGLRSYSRFAYGRAKHLNDHELPLFAMGSKLGLTERHPSIRMIRENDVDVFQLMAQYKRDKKALSMMWYVCLSLTVLVAAIIVKSFIG